MITAHRSNRDPERKTRGGRYLRRYERRRIGEAIYSLDAMSTESPRALGVFPDQFPWLLAAPCISLRRL